MWQVNTCSSVTGCFPASSQSCKCQLACCCCGLPTLHVACESLPTPTFTHTKDLLHVKTLHQQKHSQILDTNKMTDLQHNILHNTHTTGAPVICVSITTHHSLTSTWKLQRTLTNFGRLNRHILEAVAAARCGAFFNDNTNQIPTSLPL